MEDPLDQVDLHGKLGMEEALEHCVQEQRPGRV